MVAINALSSTSAPMWVKLAIEQRQTTVVTPADAVAGTRYDEHKMAMLDSEK
jgi:hypothetical protein